MINDAKEEDSIINFKAIISQIIQDREGISETREIVLKEETTEYRIKGTKTDEPDKPVDPDKPDTPTDKTYSISGTAWLDENEDGIKMKKKNY